MPPFRRLALSAAAASSAVVLGLVPTASAAPVTAPPQLPQPLAAVQAAQWLGAQFTAQGYIPAQSGPGADLSATAQGVLALSAANVDLSVATTAVTYLEANVDTYVTAGGAD